MSRVDPLSVAVYPGGESRRDASSTPTADGCSLVRGVGSYSRGAIDLDCFRFPEDQRETSPDTLAYALAVDDRTARNRLTALLLKHSDDVCVEEMGRLFGNEALVNSSLSVLGTGATTAANIVTGNLAQTILTGVGTVAGASRTHFATHIYRNTFAYAVSRAITLERDRLREALEARYDEEPSDFTVDQAIRAANAYHGTCSFYKGLELVLASVEGNERSREAQARLIRRNELEQQVNRQRMILATIAAHDGQARQPVLDRIEALEDQIEELNLSPSDDDDDDDDDTANTTNAETNTNSNTTTDPKATTNPNTTADPNTTVDPQGNAGWRGESRLAT